MSIVIRIATPADVAVISDIYNYYVDHSTCTFQLQRETVEARQSWLRARDDERHPITVAEVDGETVGWASLSEWNSRAGYARTVEASIYIHHQWHRRGIGRQMLQDLVERARAAQHHVVIGGACTEQHASIALQESLGFERVATFREVGFKFGRSLDVVYLQLMLNPSQDLRVIPS